MNQPSGEVRPEGARRLVLDLAGLRHKPLRDELPYSEQNGFELVDPGSGFNYGDIDTVLFNWGDPVAENVFAAMLEFNTEKGDNQPFNSATIIGPYLWRLELLKRDWQPAAAEAASYIEVPFERKAGEDVVKEQLHRQEIAKMIGRVGLRYVSFAERFNIKREYDKWDVLVGLKEFVDNWDYVSKGIRRSKKTAFHIAYWLLENFGSGSPEEGYKMPPNSLGFARDKLPRQLQNLTSGKRDGNIVHMETAHIIKEIEPVIPQWDYISRMGSFSEQLAYMTQNPELLRRCRIYSPEIIPQIKMLLQPRLRQPEWGIELLVRRSSADAAVFGKPGYTLAATEQAMRLNLDKALMAETVARLAILSAEHSAPNMSMPQYVSSASMSLLWGRMRGDEDIKVSAGTYNSLPEYELKKRLIQEASEKLKGIGGS